eukprot:5288837-Amphidinium_carterae.1
MVSSLWHFWDGVAWETRSIVEKSSHPPVGGVLCWLGERKREPRSPFLACLSFHPAATGRQTISLSLSFSNLAEMVSLHNQADDRIGWKAKLETLALTAGDLLCKVKPGDVVQALETPKVEECWLDVLMCVAEFSIIPAMTCSSPGCTLARHEEGK